MSFRIDYLVVRSCITGNLGWGDKNVAELKLAKINYKKNIRHFQQTYRYRPHITPVAMGRGLKTGKIQMLECDFNTAVAVWTGGSQKSSIVLVQYVNDTKLLRH